MQGNEFKRVSFATVTAAVLMTVVTLCPTSLSAQPATCVLNEAQKLIPAGTDASDRVGSSVCISGDRVVVGAWGAGSAYVYRLSDNATPLDPNDDAWVEEAKLTPSGAGGLFGWSVSISGDRAIVGARFDPSAGAQAGAAYVYRRDDNDTPNDPTDDNWVEEDKLTASDAIGGEQLGGSVAIDGVHAITGAQNDDDVGAGSGSAYVFYKDDNDTPLDPSDDFWVEQAKLIGSDEAAGDNFGISVSISGSRAVVGAWHHNAVGDQSGAAYVFRRDDNDTPADPTDDSWIEEAKLTPSDAAVFDQFGVAVAIDGDRVVVGAWLDDDGGSLTGSAYVFRRDDNDTPAFPDDDFWVEEAKLTASDATAGDELGKAVSISGDRAVIGAFEDDDACADDPNPDPNCDSGSAYVFTRDDNGTPLNPDDDTWVETAKLVASDTAAQEFFGRVAIDGTTVVTGSLSDEAGDQAGAAYMFDVSEICTPIPTVSQWGVVIMTLLFVSAGTVVLTTRRIS